MENVKFSITLKSGETGSVIFSFTRNDQPLTERLVITGTGSEKMDLEPGRYLVTATGDAPASGAVIKISALTHPKTPDKVVGKSFVQDYILIVAR